MYGGPGAPKGKTQRPTRGSRPKPPPDEYVHRGGMYAKPSAPAPPRAYTPRRSAAPPPSRTTTPRHPVPQPGREAPGMGPGEIENQARAYARARAQARLQAIVASPRGEHAGVGAGSAFVGGMGVQSAAQRGAPAGGGPGRYQVNEFLRLMHGHSVADIQHFLRSTGYDIAADGVWGPQTQAAAERFIRESAVPQRAADYLNRAYQGGPTGASDVPMGEHAAVAKPPPPVQAPTVVAGTGDPATAEQMATQVLGVPAIYSDYAASSATPWLNPRLRAKPAYMADDKRTYYKSVIDALIAAYKQRYPQTHQTDAQWEQMIRQEVAANAAYQQPGEEGIPYLERMLNEVTARSHVQRILGSPEATGPARFSDYWKSIAAAASLASPATLGRLAVPLRASLDALRAYGGATGAVEATDIAGSVRAGAQALRGQRMGTQTLRGVRLPAEAPARWAGDVGRGARIPYTKGDFVGSVKQGVRTAVARVQAAEEAGRAGRVAKTEAKMQRWIGGRGSLPPLDTLYHVKDGIRQAKPKLAQIPERQRFIREANKLPHATTGEVRVAAEFIDSEAHRLAEQQGISLARAWKEIISRTTFHDISPTVAELEALGLPAAAQEGLRPALENLAGVPEHGATEAPPDFLDAAKKLIEEHPAGALPPGHDDPQVLAKTLEDLWRRAAAAKDFKDWYLESAQAILHYVGGNELEARKLAALIAVFSPQSEVYRVGTEWNNLSRALNAYEQYYKEGAITAKYGDKTLASFGDQVEKANRIMRGDFSWEGIKTNNFSRNFFQHLDVLHGRPLPADLGTTQDIWMHRVFPYLHGIERSVSKTGKTGYAVKMANLGKQRYAFMDAATKEIADALGWTPDQAQAAIWSHVKSEVEGTPLERSYNFADAIRHHVARAAFEREQTPENLKRLEQLTARFPPEVGPRARQRNLIQWMLDNGRLAEGERAVAEEALGVAEAKTPAEVSEAFQADNPGLEDIRTDQGVTHYQTSMLYGGAEIDSTAAGFPFYSAVERAITALPEKFPVAELIPRLKKIAAEQGGSLKKEEIDRLNLQTYVDTHPHVSHSHMTTAEDVLKWFDANYLTLHETHYTQGAARYEDEAQWNEPGLNLPGVKESPHYVEIAIHVPARDLGYAYSNSNMGTHWPELENVIVHLRMSERTVDGKRTLVIEEIQSDWHQEAADRVRPVNEEAYKAEHPEYDPEDQKTWPRRGYRKGRVEDNPEHQRLQAQIRETTARIQDRVERLEQQYPRFSRYLDNANRRGRLYQAITDAQRHDSSWRYEVRSVSTGRGYDYAVIGGPEGSLERQQFNLLDSEEAAMEEARFRNQVQQLPGAELESLKKEIGALESDHIAYMRDASLSNTIVREHERGVPAGPFAKTWHELAFKRALAYAVEHGYEQLAWTTGKTQAERNRFANFFHRIEVQRVGLHPGTPEYEAEKRLAWQRHENAHEPVEPDIPFPWAEDYKDETGAVDEAAHSAAVAEYEQAYAQAQRDRWHEWSQDYDVNQESLRHDDKQHHSVAAWKHGNTAPDYPDSMISTLDGYPLEDIIGPEMAAKVRQHDEAGMVGPRTFTGEDLMMGDIKAALGTSHFYDEKIKGFAAKHPPIRDAGVEPRMGKIERREEEPDFQVHLRGDGAYQVMITKNGRRLDGPIFSSHEDAERWIVSAHGTTALEPRGELPGHGEPVHVVPITPELKAKVERGQVLYQAEHAGEQPIVKGALEMPGEASGEGNTLHLFREADFSTLIHEVAHAMEDHLPPELLASLERQGIRDPETFARSYEAYFMHGAKAPTPGLQQTYDRIAWSLAKVYKDAGGVPESLNNAYIRDTFDRYFMRRALSGDPTALAAGRWWFTQEGPGPVKPGEQKDLGVPVSRGVAATAEPAGATQEEAFNDWLRRVESGELESQMGGGGTPPPSGGRPTLAGLPDRPEGEGVGDPVQALREAFPGMKATRGRQEANYSPERAAAAERIDVARMNNMGWDAYYAARGAARGELTKLGYHGGDAFTNAEIEQLVETIRTHPSLLPFSYLRATEALEKVFLKGEVPQKNEIMLLQKIFGLDQTDRIVAHAGLPRHIIGELLNIPRSIMASIDLSAPFRQGLVIATSRHADIFWKNWDDMVKAGLSEDFYNGVMQNIIDHPNYELASYGKLAVTDLEHMDNREERFLSGYAEWLTGLGKRERSPVRASGRAYTAFLAKTRMDVFNVLVEQARNKGIDVTDDTFLKQLCSYINAATGRGDLPKWLEGSAPWLNATFFSPRLLASRIQFGTAPFRPGTWGVGKNALHPFVRNQILRSWGQLFVAASTILGLAAVAGSQVTNTFPSLKVIMDPTNADFAKIRVGNTRFDILGGFQQPFRLMGQLAFQRVTSSSTGRPEQLGSGKFGSKSSLDILWKFARGKLAPVPSVITDYLSGSTYDLKKPTVIGELKQNLIPLAIQDAGQMYGQTSGGAGGVGKALGAYGTSAVGIGIQSYGKPPPSQAIKSKLQKESKQAGLPPPTPAMVKSAEVESQIRHVTNSKLKPKAEVAEMLKLYRQLVGKPYPYKLYPTITAQDASDNVSDISNDIRDDTPGTNYDDYQARQADISDWKAGQPVG